MRRFAVLAFLVACGGRTDGDAPAAAGDAGSTSADGGSADATPDADESACNAAVAALGNVATGRYCTSLVRVSTIDRSILGGYVACGPLAVASETDARAAFAAKLPPNTNAMDYQRFGPTGPTYDFVFFRPASDFGGIGVVSLATSALVFSGELSWSALGSIVYPTSFLPASSVAPVCAPRAMPDVQAVPIEGVPDAAEVARVADVVGRSALVRAISVPHAIVHTLVVPFPVDGAPEMGAAKNEWLVVFDSGQLE